MERKEIRAAYVDAHTHGSCMTCPARHRVWLIKLGDLTIRLCSQCWEATKRAVRIK